MIGLTFSPLGRFSAGGTYLRYFDGRFVVLLLFSLARPPTLRSSDTTTNSLSDTLVITISSLSPMAVDDECFLGFELPDRFTVRKAMN